MPVDLTRVDTEGVNPDTIFLDSLDTLGMLTLINNEDKKTAEAVAAALPDVARAVDGVYGRMARGGRLIYCGAGTSGRIGVLDASECPPTFGVPEGLVIGLLAGGDAALRAAVEGAEDDFAGGAAALKGIGFNENDALVGLAASGRTPYALGAMEYARRTGGLVVGVACTRGAEMSKYADIMITPLTGPEAVAGSTRMKAGTAQKMILNMLSTGVMVKTGKVYGNRMVDVRASNEKLRARALHMVMEITGAGMEEAAAALERGGQSVKHAVVILLSGMSDYDEADAALNQHGGGLNNILKGRPFNG